jgi:hypothetical protein
MGGRLVAKISTPGIASELARWRQAEADLDHRKAEKSLAHLCRGLPWPGPSTLLVEAVLERSRSLGLLQAAPSPWQWSWAALFLFVVGWSVAGWGAMGPILGELLRIDLVASLARDVVLGLSALASTFVAGLQEWARLADLASQALNSSQFALLVTLLVCLSIAGASLLHALLRREDDYETCT